MATNLPNSLSNEVAHNTTIINVHARPIGIEDASDTDLCNQTTPPKKHILNFGLSPIASFSIEGHVPIPCCL